MAKLKTVYFCESDPEKWFYTQKEADNFDKVSEVKAWVVADFHTDFPLISSAVERIMKRYEITQRWDWKAPDQDEQK